MLSPTFATIAVCALTVYLAVISWARKRRAIANERLLANSQSPSEKVEAARQIVCCISHYEFPVIYRLGLEFGLFRTYAIPSISTLLSKTKVFQRCCGKRYDDTDLLLAEILCFPFDSPRSQLALQRLNVIHSQYTDSISNDDMMYVLSVFVFEPVRWIERVEWRNLNEAEKEALYIMWKDVGTRMGIRDIPSTRQAFEEWNVQYEKMHMVHSSTNEEIAEYIFGLFLSIAPSFTHNFVRKAAYCLMDDRLRQAMKYPDPNQTLATIIATLVNTRSLALKYFCIPRWWSACRAPLNGDAEDFLVPNFHLYEKTYKEGYKIRELGAAPAGRTFHGCPFWGGSSGNSPIQVTG